MPKMTNKEVKDMHIDELANEFVNFQKVARVVINTPKPKKRKPKTKPTKKRKRSPR
jgi:hypothetical protein